MAAYLKRLTTDDSPAIALLESKYFSDAWSVQQIFSELQSAACLAFGFFNEDKLIAYIISRTTEFDCWLMRMSVQNNWRRQGLAARLLEHSSMQLRDKPDGYFLEVDHSNEAAIKLYERCGFTQIGRREHYYVIDKNTGATHDALVMRKEVV